MNALEVSVGILGLLIIALSVGLFFLWKKINQLTQGKDAKNLEGIIIENNSRIAQAEKTNTKHHQEIDALQKDSLNNIQNIGVVRFNPFKETGGSQSFAIAMTDKNNSGVVISSLYTRDRVNVFAKPIKNGESEYRLTDEEKKAINHSHKK